MKYKIITTEDRKCQVIDMATGEDLAPKLAKLTLYMEPQDFRLELVYVDHTPVVEVDCIIDVTSLHDSTKRYDAVHP